MAEGQREKKEVSLSGSRNGYNLVRRGRAGYHPDFVECTDVLLEEAIEKSMINVFS